ncbi:MAG: SprT-like domain-containing protein [Bryobacteraceae bacterium]
MLNTREMQVESALFFETPGEIYARVFCNLKPRAKPPQFDVSFCRFANPDSFVRFEAGRIEVRMSDVLEGAPAPVLEALAYILLGKLLRRPVPAAYTHRYRLYLNRRDVRRSIHLIRQIRGRKFISGPQGDHHNLDEVFEELNFQHFGGLMARPQLGWSRRASRTTLGHYDPSHNAIIISKLLDSPALPRLALEYVLFHEMLHLRYPAQTRGARRTVHTAEFREAERAFPGFRQAKELLRKI